MAQPVERRRAYAVHVGDLAKVPVRFVRAANLSLVARALEFASPRLAADQRPAVAESPAVRPAVEALRESVTQRRLPGFVIPAPSPSSSITEQIESTLAPSKETIRADVSLDWPGGAPPAWQRIVAAPEVWRRSMGALLREIWSSTRVEWTSAGAAFERESARVGVAAVTGGLDVLLNSIHPHLSYADGVLQLRHHCERQVELAGRGIVLAPLIATRDKVMVDFEAPRDIVLAYGMPTYTSQHKGRPSDPLVMLVGPLRAAVLRTLTRPMTMGALAQHLHCAPSTLTYHCNGLEAAGLVARERRGSSVWVSRVDRTDDLLDILTAS